MRTMKLSLLLSLSIPVLWPAMAAANLRFCNRTGAEATLAIAYVEKDAPGTSTGGDKAITVEGWWSVAPNQCTVVSDIHAGNHWVYYYAHSTDGKWAGDHLLCVSSARFEKSGRFMRAGDRCQAGYHLQGFRRIGTAAKNHTHNLTGGD